MEEKEVREDELMTVREMVERNAEQFSDKVALQMRRGEVFYKITYKELHEKIIAAAAALKSIGFKKGNNAGVIGENRPEWIISYLAIVFAGGIVVPLDPQLRQKEIGHLLRVSETEIVFTSPKHISVLKECSQKTGLPKTIVSMENIEGLFSLDDFIIKGTKLLKANSIDISKDRPLLDDTLAIIFTSGTTGKSKGVMLTHRNVVYDAASARKVIKIDEKDRMLSILPLHHTFEATAGFILPLYIGVTITYARSLKSKEIIEDIQDSETTIILGVPLLYEKMLKGLRKGISEQKKLVKTVVNVNLWLVRTLRKTFKTEPGKVLFRSLREKAGLGSLRLLVSGGAALPVWVSKGFWEFGFTILQGYGLTETSPVTNVNPIEKIKFASVGPPIPGMEIKINEPEESGIGEIVVRGPIVMKGYYKDKELTETVVKDGWFYSGDLGRVDSDNYLYITGRKKSLIVSHAGKNIYPEEVEGELIISDFIEEALVVGRMNPKTKREEVHAIIYPNWEALDNYTKEQGIEQTDKWLKEFYKDEIENRCKDIAAYKRVKSFSIREEEFPKTTTKKIKRFLFQEEAIETKE
jgi:long-chain acyl-CoA synthetase